MHLDLTQTVALVGLLLVGHGLERLIPVLTRYNIPAPVVGGLPMAAAPGAVQQPGMAGPAFDKWGRESFDQDTDWTDSRHETVLIK